jgi:diguanylate cyclase (GGDEF)-like protein
VVDPASLHVLLVEDSDFDAHVVLAQLHAAAAAPFTTRHVVRIADAREELNLEPADCVLLDLALPDATGLEGLLSLVSSHPEIPFVVLSGSDEASIGAAAVQAGAQDYLTKGDIDGRQLWRAIRYAMERKRSQLLLSHQAMHDALTGLPNRVLFLDRLRVAVERLARQRGQVAVLYVDLDGFKWINDSLGHEVGDAVLVEVANRLREALRPYDTAARIGGDEFLVLADAPEDDEKATIALAERIAQLLAEPIEVHGAVVRVSGSTGITWTTSAHVNGSDLVRDADAAMYRAKALGKNRWALFDESMRKSAEHRLHLVNDLHRLLDSRALVLHHQPVVDLTTDEVVGWEAVPHWPLEDGTLLAPAELLAVAEEHGLAVPVGRAVLDSALRWLADRGRDDERYLSVNVSPLLLTHPGAADDVGAALERYGVRPHRLHLELAESRLIAQDPALRERLVDLCDIGVRLTMDDYGTGASTIAHLKELPFDLLKVDRSFVGALQRSEPDRRVMQAVVAMAHHLGLEVVADGVADPQQVARLREMGCAFGQGPLFGPPSLRGEILR